MVIYEAPHRIARTIDRSRRGVRRRRPVAVARELTKLYEEMWRGTLGDAIAPPLGEPRGEYVVVLAGAPPRRRGRRRRDPSTRCTAALDGAQLAGMRSRRWWVNSRSPSGASTTSRSSVEPRCLKHCSPSVSQYLSSGPSAAFFDLDRTLISGSSAFVFGVAAWRAGLVPPRAVRRTRSAPSRSGCAAPATTRRPACATASSAPSKGMRQDDLVALNADIVPEAARQGPARGAAPGRPAPPRRAGDVHRVGVAGRARRAAGPGARHDGRHRHAQRGRRRRLHRRAGRAVLLRAGQGRGDAASSPAGRASTSASATPTATRPATCRCCEAVGHPVAVNPDGRSSAIARDNGWPIVVFSQRTKAVVRRTTRPSARWRRRGRLRRRRRYARRRLLGAARRRANSVAATTATRRILGGRDTPTRIRRMRTGF